jgi:hypothetical protein
MSLARLSRTPLHAPSFLVVPRPTLTLAELGMKNGDVLYLAGHTPETLATAAAASSSAASSSATSAASAHVLTARCQHGPRGACPHCLGVEPGTEDKVLGKCNHGSHTTCIHCSAVVASKSTELPVWLCTHPDTVFCNLCIPKLDEAPGVVKPMSCACDRTKGQECSRCLVAHDAPTIRVDKIPYARYLGEKSAMCKFKHGASMSCAMCVPPEMPSFTGKKSCDKGHQPWPAGVCLSCAPANATIKEQVSTRAHMRIEQYPRHTRASSNALHHKNIHTRSSLRSRVLASVLRLAHPR